MGAWKANPATCKTPLLHLSPFLITAVEVRVLLPWCGAEQWVSCFPDERLRGAQQKEFTLSCKRAMSYSVTWKGNTISAQCLGFFWGYFLFDLFCSRAVFVLPRFPLKPLESLECVFVKAATCRSLNPSFGSVVLLAGSPELAPAFSLAKSLLHLGRGFCKDRSRVWFVSTKVCFFSSSCPSSLH